MFRKIVNSSCRRWNFPNKHISTSQSRNYKVTVLGAAGGIGQPLSLLLKMNPLVTSLALYDLNHTVGVAADLSHIDTSSVVTGYVGPEQLVKAVSCADVIICTAGLARKPGMSREDLFKTNVGIVKECVEVIATIAPKALIAIVTNPVNSIVPMVAETLKKSKVYDPNRLFGVTILDVVRMRTFVGEILQRDPSKMNAIVIAGHSALTILPLLSLIEPALKLEQEEIEKLTELIQNAGTFVVEAKAGAGSATLSMAYSGAKFVDSLLKGLKGSKGIVECAYVESNLTECSFFASPVLLGKNGLEKILPLPCMSEFERALLECIIPILKKDIEQGVTA